MELYGKNVFAYIGKSLIGSIVYIEPLTVSVLEKIIAKEKPDSVLPTLGGQAGLNLGME